MSIYLIFTSLFLSLFFYISYLFFVQYIYKVKEKKLFNLRNTFLYEVTPKFYEKTSFINYVLLFGVGFNFFPFIYYVVYNLETYSVTLLIIGLILLFVLCLIPFIGLDKLREHLYFDVSSIALLLGLFIVESYYSYSLYRLYQNDYQLVAMIIALVLLVFTLLMIFNPKLFDLKNELDEKTGTYKRKKVIWQIGRAHV